MIIHPVTGQETLERDWAASMYEGGTLYYAADCNHGDNKRLGLVCPLCNGALFLAKGEVYRPTWRHYHATEETAYCERRVMTAEVRSILTQLQPKARGQRLSLFNRRYWEIFTFERKAPRDPYALCQKHLGKALMRKTVTYCRDRWDVPTLVTTLPQQLHAIEKSKLKREIFLRHPATQHMLRKDPKTALATVDYFENMKFSVLRLKILSEVIAWLGTPSGKESFAKTMCLAILDCLEVLKEKEVTNSNVANMMVTSLVITDWERAIASLDNTKTRGIGFAPQVIPSL